MPMHASITTTRTMIRVNDPYGEGFRTFPRSHSTPIRKQMHKAIEQALEAEREANPNVWWNKIPYSVSIRPADSGERGLYTYSVNRTDI